MNQVHNYVIKQTEKIKNKEDYDDVVQSVLLVLIQKNLYNTECDDKLKNYIKGIIWNISTTIYKQGYYYTTYTDCINDYEYIYNTNNNEEPFYIDETEEYKKLLHNIRTYIFENYYKKNKSIIKWKCWYLKLKGYDYRYISDRLNLTYKSCIEYNYKCNTEIKSKFIN
ncbi:sigma-70 RNA polymerase sigma factor region 4 domain-containing protein [Belliella pelovolcani]|uniref:Uncharacterized protein n=1 Tax=Belliella pelovolcani TaxID=529505 RepID=A0A1N7MRU6_9BACT|nr:sigma-70 family RNA polymerase sigma factor [Belliella pelovolcani]SIS88748.1 hypothetical protein SAMN05421761_10772 [Belliella pelovolcani]